MPASPHAPLWNLRPGVTYLNHGSFGPSPRSVQAARHELVDQLESEPVDFLVRQLEDRLDAARERLATFVGTKGRHLLFVDNATFGMNIVAQTFPLAAGDEVLATDHEYGAVLRIWRQQCQRTGAALVVRKLPTRFESPEELADELLAGTTPRTRLLVVSHVTSPTAVILPVREICARARQLGIAVCIDGPHAPAAVPVHIDQLGCDFYTASCHKWLSAPFGSGFLYVHPRWQGAARPAIVSWGNSLSGRAPQWSDEFNWSGTRDPSAFLSIPAAIDFLEQLPPVAIEGESLVASVCGIAGFRQYAHDLARYARRKIQEVTQLEPLVPDRPDWYGPMIALPLPASIAEPPATHVHPLQQALWEQFRIEVPIVNWQGRRYVRVSCHLYNARDDIDRLVDSLQSLLATPN
ncbi:MAG: aminotransferase class V-fold PLP-dependent enzyme [Planctomycetales bacterium]